MAELNAATGGERKKRSGGKRSKKLSTRVDLTPMVDLGFLLITFFIFTTTMSQPKSLRLILPKDSPDPMKTKASGALTLIPSDRDYLFYYEGEKPSSMQKTHIHSARELIRSKKSRTSPSDFMVIIKPTSRCNYKNTIATLDEMSINQVKRYALVDLSETESKVVDKMEN